MKKPVVDLVKLSAELNAWGLETELEYDANEEAYVIHAGEILNRGKYAGKREVTIAPGFLYSAEGEERILAYSDNLHIHMTDPLNIDSSSHSRIVASSRTSWFAKTHSEQITLAGLVA